ncbi:(2Fe-2S)-binding protein [Halomonas sp. WWR20]
MAAINIFHLDENAVAMLYANHLHSLCKDERGDPMYVCICKRVTDRTIRETVNDGARSWREVQQSTGCATQCGKCACLGKKIVNEAVARELMEASDLAYAV